MIELLKFILEEWQNTAIFFFVMFSVTFCLSIILGSLKPITYTTIINESKERLKDE